MSNKNGQTGRVGAPVPPHVAAIAEAQRQALAARMAAQEAARAEAPAFSPVQVGTTKRQVRSRNYRK